MANTFSMDPQTVLKILVGGGGPDSTAATPDQILAEAKRGFNLQNSQQLQGGAHYTVANAIRDALGGYFGRDAIDRANLKDQGLRDNAAEGIASTVRPFLGPGANNSGAPNGSGAARLASKARAVVIA